MTLAYWGYSSQTMFSPLTFKETIHCKINTTYFYIGMGCRDVCFCPIQRNYMALTYFSILGWILPERSELVLWGGFIRCDVFSVQWGIVFWLFLPIFLFYQWSRKWDGPHQHDLHGEWCVEELCGAGRDVESWLHHWLIPLECSHVPPGALDGQIWATPTEAHWQVWHSPFIFFPFSMKMTS